MQVLETPTGFKVKFDYNKSIIADLKKVCNKPQWIHADRVWNVKLSDRLALNKLQAKYRKVGTNINAEVGIIPPMPELEIELPLKLNPFHYQGQGIAQGIRMQRFINGDDPGLGKTLQAIATLIALEKKGEQVWPALIICPSVLKINWHKEFEKVAGLGKKAIVMETDSLVKTWPVYYNVAGCKAFICNYESLKKFFVQTIEKHIDPQTNKTAPLKLSDIIFREPVGLFKSVVIDELHRCKEGSNVTSKIVRGLTIGKKFVIGLTGTPVVNKEKDLLYQLEIINRLGEFGGSAEFNNRYCKKPTEKLREELNYLLNTKCFFRRLKKDVLKDLPERMRQIVMCEITNRTEYEKAKDDLEWYLREMAGKSDDQIDSSLRAQALVRIGICRNIAARGKVDAAIEFIDEIISSGKKVGVFIDKRDIGDKLKAHYPHALIIRGQMDNHEREESVVKFQNDPKYNIILLSIKAAREGLTLTAAHDLIFIEHPWNEAIMDQCESRAHRNGQRNVVLSKVLLGQNTIDEYTWAIVEKKGKIASTVTGSDVSVEKELINMLLKRN